MGVTHDANITVTIYLSTLAGQRASFSIPMIVVALSNNSLNSNRTATYTTLAEAQAANTAGYIHANTLAMITRMFAQSPAPSKVKVGYIDDVSSPAESESAALTAIIADDPDFYVVCYETRTDADIVAMAAAIEAADKRMLGVFQSSSADWKTSGVPSAYSSATSYERSAILYHDTDANWNDMGWAASRAAFDADVRSAPWHGRVKSGDALASGITDTERDYILENGANVGLPYSSVDYYVDSGQNLSDRAIYEIVSTDWFATRIEEDIADAVVSASNRGEKITVDAVGQAIISGIIKSRLAQGQAAQHFAAAADEVSVVAEDITAADIAAERLRFTVRAKLAIGARTFSIDVYASRTSLTA